MEITILCVDNGYVVTSHISHTDIPPVRAVFTSRSDLQDHINELMDSAATEEE